MTVRELTTQNFNALIETGTVVIDWWAPWCPPCRAFAPVFAAASERHSGLVFAKVDADAQQGLAAAFHIQALPTLMIFRDGILLFREPGMPSARELDLLLEEIGAIDMAELRRRLESRNASPTERTGT